MNPSAPSVFLGRFLTLPRVLEYVLTIIYKISSLYGIGKRVFIYIVEFIRKYAKSIFLYKLLKSRTTSTRRNQPALEGSIQVEYTLKGRQKQKYKHNGLRTSGSAPYGRDS